MFPPEYSIFNYFDYLSYFIGDWGATFFVVLFTIILLRIIIAFVFKFFRINLDYNTTLNRIDKLQSKSSK